MQVLKNLSPSTSSAEKEPVKVTEEAKIVHVGLQIFQLPGNGFLWGGKCVSKRV